MKKKASNKIWNLNIKQKEISKKIDRICVVFCLIATLVTAILQYKDRQQSNNKEGLHGGRTVI